jgi:uncharacterized protein YndB with AHSA1/START domain
MASTQEQGTSTKDRDIVIHRLVNAPRELVFDAWTSPEHVAQWWGPNGFSTTIHEMDVRPGGVWRFIMHGPDGADYDNTITYLEVVRPERLVYQHGDEHDPSQFDATVTFFERDGQTEVVMKSVFPTSEARDYVVRQFGAIEGGKQTLGRLADYVENMPR